MSEVDFVFTAPSSVMRYQTIEVSHTSFGNTFRAVSNDAYGITAKVDGVDRNFDYVPMEIMRANQDGNLSRNVKVRLADLGEELGHRIENAFNLGTMITQPKLISREYRSDDLSAPLNTKVYWISDCAYSGEGVEITAGEQVLNITRTGEIYDFNKFASLRGVARS